MANIYELYVNRDGGIHDIDRGFDSIEDAEERAREYLRGTGRVTPMRIIEVRTGHTVRTFEELQAMKATLQ